MPPANRAQLLKQAQEHVLRGRSMQAETICRQLLAKRSRDIEAKIILARIAAENSKWERAAELLGECLKIRPRDVQLQFLLGRMRHKQERYDEAMEIYDRILRVKRGFLPATTGKAGVHELRGERPEALALLEPIVAAEREDVEMAGVYVRLQTQAGAYDRAIEVGGRNMDKPAPDDVKRTLGHAMGQACERAGDYDRAFAALTMANEIVRRPFSVEAAAAKTDRIIALCNAETIARLPKAAAATDLPVFVIGMPRSGTTLVERLIDAHPQGHAGGELSFMPQIVDDIATRIGSTTGMPDCFAELEQKDVDELSAEYLDRLRALAPDATRIVDKQLGNDVAMGLLQLLFPQARVIHCRRNAADSCFSVFSSQLPAAFHPYATDLAWIAHVFLDRERLMAHWKQTLSMPILTVNYEDVVADQQRESRRIIDFCGLPWDEECLRYYEKDTQSSTLSYDQVRRPVYSSSVGRAGRFEKHLGPLHEVLGVETPKRRNAETPKG